MHAYLVDNKNSDDFYVFAGEKHIFWEVFKIEDVRALKASLKFSPKVKTIFVLQSFDNCSLEAQNAMLKILEEPPHENVFFVLTYNNLAKIIPTIRSRVSLVKNSVSEKNVGKNQEVFSNLRVGEQAAKLFSIVDRAEAMQFLYDISQNSKESIVVRESALINAHNLSQNTNVVLTLLNVFLASSLQLG